MFDLINKQLREEFDEYISRKRKNETMDKLEANYGNGLNSSFISPHRSNENVKEEKEGLEKCEEE